MKKSLLLWISLFIIAGSMLAACSGAVSMSLTGDWKLIAYGPSTNPILVGSDVETSLSFGPDGKLNGNVGCNSFNGEYKVDGANLTFGPIASTMMACADPIMQQESTVFNVFTDTATFKIEGNVLTVISADGNSAVTFERK